MQNGRNSGKFLVIWKVRFSFLFKQRIVVVHEILCIKIFFEVEEGAFISVHVLACFLLRGVREIDTMFLIIFLVVTDKQSDCASYNLCLRFVWDSFLLLFFTIIFFILILNWI